MKTYDVIIAGAGLAGLAIAKELSGSGLSVLVLDKKSRASHVAYHSSGTFMDPSAYNIPAEFFHPINEIEFSSKNETCLKKVENCSVLDRRKLYAWMENEALKDTNIKLRLGCRIKSIKTGWGKVSGITYSDKGREVLARAKVYIDCTGLPALFGRKSGLTPEKCVMAPGVEHLVPLKANAHRAYLFVGGGLAGGYGWVFPKSAETSIAGAGFIRHEKFSLLEKAFEEMWKKKHLSEICRRRTFEKNFAALRTGKPLTRFTKGNLMIVGAAALQPHPLIGEGIRFVLDAALEAALCVKQAFKTGDMNEIHKYGRQWKKKYLKQFRFSYFMQKVLKQATMSDWILDRGVKVMRSCNEYQFRRVISADISLSFMIFITVEAWLKLKTNFKF